MNRWARYSVPIVLVAIIFVVYVNSRIINSWDSRWTIYTAVSIIKEGNTDLDEYKEALEENEYFAIETFAGRHYSRYPVIVPLIAVPFVYIADKALIPAISAYPWLEKRIRNSTYIRRLSRPLGEKLDVIELREEIEMYIAALIVSATSFLIFLISRRELSVFGAAVVTIVFAFGTSAWSTAS
ncbi:MAG: hypothetical protein J7M12_01320, partial [Candidatus Hydrogenedentes bacterium]|nr:hypothetical protein [Candidatus Hydrogenedentota bacterium]